MRWRWEGELRIEPMRPEMIGLFGKPPAKSVWPSVVEIQAVGGRAYVVTDSYHTRFRWFLMDLEGLETPGAPNGKAWVQVSLGGNVPPKTRNTEHISKEIEYLAPSYVDEKFPGLGDLDYLAIGYYLLPFLVRIFEMEPLEGAIVED
jgi:hypothetical protein